MTMDDGQINELAEEIATRVYSKIATIPNEVFDALPTHSYQMQYPLSHGPDPVTLRVTKYQDNIEIMFMDVRYASMARIVYRRERSSDGS